MNPCGGGEGGKQSLVSSGLPCSFQQLKASPSEKHNFEEKSARVKRRRTRRERNYVKFGRNVSGRTPEQRPNCKGLQKMLPPFWSSRLSNCAPVKGTCVAKPVIITQNRLSQHLGMFNREVKSADIERLLSPRNEQEVMEVTPIQRDTGVEKLLGEEVQSCKSCDANQKLIPSEQSGCNVKDPSRMNEDSLLTVVPAVPMLVTERHPVAILHAVDSGSQPAAASAALEFSQQTRKTEAFQSNASVVLNEKENVPPAPTAGAEPGKGKSPVRELAQDLQKLLDLKTIFPGRNLIGETRQAVLNVLREQKKTLPDLSALALLKKLAGGCNSDAIHADFKSPAKRDQEVLQMESKSSNCSSKNSEQGVSLNKRRGQEQFFLISPSASPVHTAIRMAEKRPAHREDFESFVEPGLFDQHSFYLAAVQPHPHLLSASSQHVNSARSSFASEEQCPAHKALLRTAQHWKQRPGESLWEPRSWQERFEVGNRVLPKNNISKRHCLPFAAHDSLGSANPSMNDSGRFFLTDPQQYPCIYELSQGQWNSRETESAPFHSPHHSPELRSSQPLDLGLRATERAACESQTSFDVLKSIWSPKMPSKGAKLSVSQVLGYPCLAHQLPSSRELNFEQGQPKEFLPLYNIIPQQHCSFYRQNPQQEVCVPSRHQQHGTGLISVLAKPRTYCQKVSVEQGRTSNSYQLLGLTEAPERMQGARDKGSSRSGNQAHDLERLLQLEGTQQLQVFQQLPMSYFPPSEALENRNSPLRILQGHLLGQASPEPWAFPRMKLY